MRGVLIEISLFEAFFKVHYTKGFRLSYPIPLPTSVAGIFGALLGIPREEIENEFRSAYFGAKLVSMGKENFENATFIQIGKKFENWPPGVALTQFFTDPVYHIILASEDMIQIEKIFETLKRGFKFLPYGGQNDFFVKDVKLVGTYDVIFSDLVENYAPKNWIIKTEINPEKDSFLSILPVMHKISDEPFYFGYKTKFFLSDKIPTINNIGLYELSKFYYPTK